MELDGSPKHRLHDLRKPEAEGVGAKAVAKTDTRKVPDSGMNQSPCDRNGSRPRLLTVFLLQLVGDPSLFVAVRNLASAGLLGSRRCVRSTHVIAGNPSRINSHRQLLRPNQCT